LDGKLSARIEPCRHLAVGNALGGHRDQAGSNKLEEAETRAALGPLSSQI